MGVSAPSATAMTKRLAELGLVERAPYRGVALTAEGGVARSRCSRHHRLLERYLADRLGMSLDEVHAEADRLEHALSEELEARIDAALGYPTHDPHGDPIPDRELRLEAAREPHARRPRAGRAGRGRRACRTATPSCCATSRELGLVPGSAVEVVAQAPFDGPVTVRTGNGEHAISRELAARHRRGGLVAGLDELREARRTRPGSARGSRRLRPRGTCSRRTTPRTSRPASARPAIRPSSPSFEPRPDEIDAELPARRLRCVASMTP